MRISLFTLLFLTFCFQHIYAQNGNNSENRLKQAKNQLIKNESSLFKNLKAPNIGPTVFSGRVVAIRVNPKKVKEFYVAYASGGLWHTNNNGNSFTPLFDQELSYTIGDFDVNWDTGEIWVGTGEVNSSRSSYAGIGMLYSDDKGENWVHKGLDDTHHIGKVIIAPNDPNTIYVAALGHLYTTNEQRGVFKSSDKGNTWQHILSINDKTGVVDLILNPNNSNELWAAAWERDRKAWNFTEAGPGSTIYHTTDAGKSWNSLDKTSGLPIGEQCGRIGLSLSFDQNQPVLYALIDNYNRKKADLKEKNEGLESESFLEMSKEQFLKIDNDKLTAFLEENYFDEKYTAKYIKKEIKKNKLKPSDLHHYLYDANKMLFDTPVIGAELYRSNDNGRTWNKTNTVPLNRLYNSYGYYFGLVQADQNNPDIVYIAGVPIYRSDDGGKTFKNINQENVHVDHHALWINPNDPDHLINGNDGGINISYDGGEHYFLCNSPAVGQFYSIQVDNAKRYNVYGGTQDNGVWKGPNTYKHNYRWQSNGQYPYKRLMGGDGMQIQVDERGPIYIYTGYQFGNYYRINETSGESEYITPKHKLGSSPYRWNWQTPILLSSHNRDILYMGCNKLMRSMDKGMNFKEISNDLTDGGIKGDVAFGTLTSIDESPLEFGLLYVGTDDGNVHRTDNGGASWQTLSNNLPKKWVSKIAASQHDINTVYMAMNGYRDDDFTAYLYKSHDKGNTWIEIGKNLPMECINMVLEDPEHPEILYVGTDNGVYISTDEGDQFSIISLNIPRVPVHDLKIQNKAQDLIVGTHGRSLYKVDLSDIYRSHETDYSSLAGISKKVIYKSRRWGTKNIDDTFNEAEVDFCLFSPQSGKVTFTLEDSEGNTLYTWKESLNMGYNYPSIKLDFDKKTAKKVEKTLNLKKELNAADNGRYYLPRNEFQLKMSQGKLSHLVKLSIK